MKMIYAKNKAPQEKMKKENKARVLMKHSLYDRKMLKRYFSTNWRIG